MTCLGPAGHHLEVIDSDPACIARFSRWVRRVHRCPHAGREPLAYLTRLEEIVAERTIDAVLPTHEQAWLLSAGRPLLSERVRVAVADQAAFERVQSKVAFAQLLDELGLPQPRWRPVAAEADLADLAFPYWLKATFSTAGQGVRHVTDARTRAEASRALLGDGTPAMAQEHATGTYGQVQALFDRGRLLAVHTTVQRASGMGGSAAARTSVDHPVPREHVAALGEALAWHGGLTLDYLHDGGAPRYIECNPRTVEPGNAAAGGVNLPDLQVRLTLGDPLAGLRIGRPGVRTHGTLAVLIGAAAGGASRRALLAQLVRAARHRGVYEASAEQLTPLRADPPSVVPLAVVAARLLASPSAAWRVSARTVGRYSVGPDAIATVARALATRHAAV